MANRLITLDELAEREIVGPERDALILSILKRIQEARPHADHKAWEARWREALDYWREKKTLDALVPEFIREAVPVRRDGAFWHGVSELDYVRGLHEWLAAQFHDCESIHEFGCGTGWNLVCMPVSRQTYGYDLSPSAVQMVNEAAAHFGLQVSARQFDMLAPWPCGVNEGDGVFTFGSMEQLGNFAPFVDFLAESKPRKVIHIEPIPELLDEDNLIDWLSLQFHMRRGYTVGLLPYLLEHPLIEVQSIERSHFGSLMLESYARIVWQPR